MVCCMRVGTRTKVTVDALQLGLICSPFGPILFTKFWRASVDRRKNVVIGGAWDLWLTTTPESTKGALVLTHVSHHCTYNVSIFLLILFLFHILIEESFYLFCEWVTNVCIDNIFKHPYFENVITFQVYVIVYSIEEGCYEFIPWRFIYIHIVISKFKCKQACWGIVILTFNLD